MKILTKIALLILVLCQLVCCFTGCNLLKGGEETTGESTFELTEANLASYTIIVPSQSKDSMESVASFLQNIIYQKISVTLEIKTDEVEATEYEILVGLTNRAESVAFYENVKENNYGYALVGKKLVLAGNTAKLVKEAMLMFSNDVINKTGSEGITMASGSEKMAELRVEETTESAYTESILNGLTINALGDSYFDGQGLDQKTEVWLGLLASEYKLRMNNYGKGGSTVSNYVTDKKPMCVRYADMPNNNADIILLEGGRNDFNKGVPIGTTDSRDTKTFSGALNVIIDGLKEKYPNAMIVCISNWNFPGTSASGLKYTDYAGAMENVAEAQGVYFIKACDPDVSGINMNSEVFRTAYCIKASDISHLNAKGMKIAFEHFAPILEEYYTDFLSKKSN